MSSRHERNAVASRTGVVGRRGRHRHRHRRVLRHAGQADGQTGLVTVVCRGRCGPRCGVLQLPARRRRRHEHRRRLHHLQLGDRLRRHGHDAGLLHASAAAVAAGNRAGDGRPVVDRRQAGHPGSPQHPQQTDRQAGRQGAWCPTSAPNWSSWCSRLLPRSVGVRIPRAHPGDRLQRRLRDAGIDANGAASARHPAGHDRCGHVLRRRQGRVQFRAAGDRIQIRPCPRHVRQPHHLQERRQGDRRPARQEPDVHGEIR